MIEHRRVLRLFVATIRGNLALARLVRADPSRAARLWPIARANAALSRRLYLRYMGGDDQSPRFGRPA